MVGTLFELTMLALSAQAYLAGDHDQARRILALNHRKACADDRRHFVSASGGAIGDAWGWMEGLRARGADALRIAYFPTKRHDARYGYILPAYHFDHRFNPVEGGVRNQYDVIDPPNPSPWVIIVSLPKLEEYWWPHADFIRDSKGYGGHWRYTYILAPGSIVRPRLPAIEDARGDLIQALEAIIDYAGSGFWVENQFAPALERLVGAPAAPSKVFPDELNIQDERAALLGAVSDGWVFAGMGAWNDSGPLDSERQDHYETVTRDLYAALCFALVAAVNHGQTEARV